MGAGGQFGTLHAQQHLRQMLLHNNVLVMGKPEVYIAHPWEKVDAAGRLTDEPTCDAIRSLLLSLRDWVWLLDGGSAPAEAAGVKVR